MSGFEIAGVVLSSLPLIIAALEHYVQGMATAKRFWTYKSKMESLILEIDTEQGIFINTCEQLLTGIVRVEHMQRYLDDPGGDLWRDPQMEGKLKERLKRSYGTYLANVRGMRMVSEKFMEKLKLGPDGKTQFSDPNAFKYQYRKLKFCISKSEYAELLGNLKQHNFALSQLTRQSLELEPSRTENKLRYCPNFKALQNYAQNLYGIIRSGWRCSCQGHVVNLRLESRSRKVHEENEHVEQLPFRVIFAYNSDADTSSISPHSCAWKEADIRYIQEEPKSVPCLSPLPILSAFQTPKKKVRFIQVEKETVSTLPISPPSSMSASTSTLNPVGSRLPTMNQIQDLCEAIARLQQPYRNECSGYLTDELKRKYGIYFLDSPAVSEQQWMSYSLNDVLARKFPMTSPLTQNDKLRVAVDLASSALQLYKTPWLEEMWTKDDVLFIHRPGASPYDHPFVSQRFSPPSITSGEKTDTTTGLARYGAIRNPTIFSLGVLLIELWYGTSIEELQIPTDMDRGGTTGVVWCTAERLVTEIAFQAGIKYSEAVRRCIRCDFDRRDVDLDDEGFQQTVYNGVVALLEKTLKDFNSLD
jgi:hypothetical protein